MARDGTHAPRKRRTRQHIIADLSANHIERFVLLAGHTVERLTHDYGLDLVIFFYDRAGHFTNGQVYVQLKATDKPRKIRGGRFFTVDVDIRDLRAWSAQLDPVILVLYDPNEDAARWLYIQASDQCIVPSSPTARTRRMRIPSHQVINIASIARFAEYNNRVLEQVKASMKHEA